MGSAPQLEITQTLDTKLLVTLEVRALKRRNYFRERVHRLCRERDKRVKKGISSYNSQYRSIILAETKLKNWTNRLEQIHIILTERMLLTDTEFNK